MEPSPDVPPSSDETWRRRLLVLAVALGGTSAIFHGVHHARDSGWLTGSAFMVTGQGLLYAAPVLLGVLAGLFATRPVVDALRLVGITLLTAAPLMLGDLVCLIVILPVCVVVAPLVAWLVAWLAGPRRRRAGARGVGTAGLLLATPFAMMLGQRLFPPEAPQSVEIESEIELDVPRSEVWASLELIELDLSTSSPLWLELLVPNPRAIIGGGSHVGARRRVVFDGGVALGTVTESLPPERFTFAITTTSDGPAFFDHWVTLESSSIRLEQSAAGRTRVVHRTRYRPHALPRWYFEPIERGLGGALQDHLLEAYGRALWPRTKPDRGATLAQR